VNAGGPHISIDRVSVFSSCALARLLQNRANFPWWNSRLSLILAAAGTDSRGSGKSFCSYRSKHCWSAFTTTFRRRKATNSNGDSAANAGQPISYGSRRSISQVFLKVGCQLCVGLVKRWDEVRRRGRLRDTQVPASRQITLWPVIWPHACSHSDIRLSNFSRLHTVNRFDPVRSLCRLREVKIRPPTAISNFSR